jgi:hypothetical protein
MQGLRDPSVLLFNLPTEFLEHILEEDIPTTLIVCSTREAFLQELLASLHIAAPASQPDSTVEENEGESHEPELHSLLLPTIHLIATSKNIKLVFCHTLQHVRAFLSVFKSHDGLQTDRSTAAETSRPNLAILNLVAIHHDTTEFSAQGLSRTFALAVDVAVRERANLTMCECKGSDEQDDMIRGRGLWEVEVPLLNGTVRFGDEDREWAGRLVKVKRVAQRWFIFNMEEEEGGLPDAMDV